MRLSRAVHCAKFALFAFFCALFSLAGFGADAAPKPVVAVYGAFYPGGNPNIQNNIDDVKHSGFTRVICWCIHVNPNGDLVFNDPLLVHDGVYSADPTWPSYLSQLKQGSTTVNSLYFSVGSGGVQDYAHIRELIRTQGTGPTSILYRNFRALKQAFPYIDGIDLDVEDDFDHDTIVAFSLMMGQLGMKVTFCPYFAPNFWVSCLADVERQSPGLVTGFNLQCYDGGAGNNPADWVNAIQQAGFSVPVYPGLWAHHFDCTAGDSPAQVQAKITGWKDSGIAGGFIWHYDDVQRCGPSSTDYANAIASSLPSDAVSASLVTGTYTLTPSGDAVSRLNAVDSGAVGGTAVNSLATNGQANQNWIVIPVGDRVYKIQPSYALGLALEVSGSGVSGTAVDLGVYDGRAAQRWTVSLNSDRTITLRPVSAPGLSLDLRGDSVAIVATDSFSNGQKWVLSPSSAPYQLIPFSAPSLRLDVPFSRSTSGASVDIANTNGQSNQAWFWTNLGGLTFKIQQSYAAGLVLDVPGPGLAAPATLSSDNGGSAQRWRALLNANGTFALSPQDRAGMVLEIPNVTNGAIVHDWTDTGVAYQQWIFQRVPPVVSAIAPAPVMKSATGAVITVTGSYFASSATAMVNDRYPAAVTFVSATTLTVGLPANVTSVPGSYFLRVTNPANGGASALREFQVRGPAPVITQLSPSSLPAGSLNAPLTIKGTGFLSTSRITFNGGAYVIPSSQSPTQLVVLVPTSVAEAAGEVAVRVINSAIDGGPSVPATLKITPGLTLTSVSPGSATLPKTNLLVTLMGSGFLAGAHVTLNNTASYEATVVSSTQIRFTIPAPQLGSYDVRVVNPGPVAPSNAKNLTIALARPTIASLTPATVTAGSIGVSMTISGTGFLSSSRVTLNGGELVIPTAYSSTRLIVTIPAGAIGAAGIVAVRVVNEPLNGGASEPATLTVFARPVIASLAPGSVKAGSSGVVMTIAGMGFFAGSHVTFSGGAQYTPSAYSSTRLIVTIPTGAIVMAGSVAVRVVNPPLSGGSSEPSALTVTSSAPR
jgi:hypothetical protein